MRATDLVPWTALLFLSLCTACPGPGRGSTSPTGPGSGMSSPGNNGLGAGGARPHATGVTALFNHGIEALKKQPAPAFERALEAFERVLQKQPKHLASLLNAA